jgi:putative transposase
MDTTLLGNQFRLYPTVAQEQELLQWCGNARFVWNYFRDEERNRYAIDKKFNFSTVNSKHLTELKKELPWLDHGTRDSYTQVLRHLDRAIIDASKTTFERKGKRKGFPRYKRKRHGVGSVSGTKASGVKMHHIDYENNTIRLPKIGVTRIVWSRKLPGEFKSWTIKQRAGKWYISFKVEVPKQPKVTQIKSTVGVDLNSKDIAVTSDAVIIPNPKFYAKTKRELRKAQRSQSRKQKGSNNRRKQTRRVQKLYDRVRNQRRDFLDKLTTDLVMQYDVICLEDLNIRAMQRWNGRMIQDAGFGEIRRMMNYKADLYGKHVIFIDRYAPSTQMCSNCGHVKTDDEKLTLNDRIYECDECGHEMFRDLNAAINIKQIGMGSAEYTPVESVGNGVMCRGDITNPVTMNQEYTVREPTLSSNERSE